MRQPPDYPSVDGEGFPQGNVMAVGNSQDSESGEVLSSQVTCLRKLPQLKLSPKIDSLLSCDVKHLSLNEKRRFNGFRIHAQGKTWDGPSACHTVPRNLVGSHLQTYVYMHGGSPVQYTARLFNPHVPAMEVVERNDYTVRHVFRVPKASLPTPALDQPHKASNTLNVSIWEEFIFGNSVINPPSSKGREASIREEEEEEGTIEYFRRILSPYIPKGIIDMIIYAIYFCILFASCVGYNMFCELGCYILFHQHLKIHEKAYEQKVNVVFTGSTFQGPLYVLTRNFCEHCKQGHAALVMMRHMKKMKVDILRHLDKTDTFTGNTSR